MAIHFDTQGPAPDGFHVPSRYEWDDLVGILYSSFGFPKNGATMKTYLKLPLAGRRSSSSSDVSNQGSYGYYWTPSYMGNYSYYFWVGDSSVEFTNYTERGSGYSLRCFKDRPVTPDNNRTQLYDGGDGPQGELTGIYHNATLGLISISSNGTNRTTIQDKNLGATTVYNDGDTLSEANCGKYYQRGNNYGFPRTGSVTTSSTLVDASNYGPGNYYESSVFITGSSDWNSVRNDNLWGGVSQGTWETPDPIRLHGAIQTFHRERPYEWEPGSNTVVYYDIDDNDTTTNIYDKSGNNYTQTWNGTAGYTTDVDYGRVATFNGSSYTQAGSIVDFGSEYTFIALFKTTSTSSNVQAIVLECASTTVYPIGLGLNHGGAYDLHSSGQGNSYSHLSYGTAGQQIAGEWIMLVGTRDSNGNGKLYLNGNKIAEGTVAAPNYSTGEALQIGRWRNGDANYLNGQFKLFIGENRCWGDVEIKKFYNWYKAQHKIPSRKPSANTIAYFPFVDDANNHTSNAISLTNTGTKDTIGYTFTTTSTLNTQSYDTQVKYLGGWYKVNSVTTTGNNGIFYIPYVGWISYNVGQQASNKRGKVCLNDSNWGLLASKDITLDLGNWHHLAYIIDGTDIKLAIDGIVYDFYNGSTPSFNSPIYLTDIASMNVTLSDFILEDKSRTEQEILAYYEGTKDKYIPEASPAFEEQTFTYSAFGRNGSGQYGGDEETYTFQYPYENVIIDYTMQSTGTASSGGGQVTLTIYKNDVQVLQDVMGYYDLYKSGTFESISCEAGDIIKVRRDHIINARDGRQVDGTAHMNAT